MDTEPTTETFRAPGLLPLELTHRQLVLGERSVHVVEAGPADGPAFVLLHGWPANWRSWSKVMAEAAASGARVVALDLPGVGLSPGATDGTKRELAAVVHEVIEALDLGGCCLVGHDVGGMVAYSYLRRYRDVTSVAILDVAIPGVAPWDEVLHNPWIWHFAFHSIPELPEQLVQGNQAAYFAYFYDATSADGSSISTDDRAAYVAAYASDDALGAGFDWYRAFRTDGEHNGEDLDPVETPLLYVRGDREGGEIDAYVAGFGDAGVKDVAHTVIPGAGHFSPEEAPAGVWEAIRNFAGGHR